MSVSSKLSAIAPQFNSDSSRDEFISIALTRINYCQFGNNAELAHAYMVAHMMTMRDLASQSGGMSVGRITSMKQGDLSIGFKATGQRVDEKELLLTDYGQGFLQLQNGSIAAIGLTGASGFCDLSIDEDC